jgi:hypothetical protein
MVATQRGCGTLQLTNKSKRVENAGLFFFLKKRQKTSAVADELSTVFF